MTAVEWVETTGRTIEEALDAALDELGVDVDEAEYEVLEEPKAGLFGRMRSEARVRARVRPTKPRPKEDRRRRRPAAETAEAVPAPDATTDAGEPAAVPSDAPASSEAPAAPAAKPRRSRAAASTGAPAKKAAAGTPRAPAAPAAVALEPDEAAAIDEVASVAEDFLSGLLPLFGADVSYSRRIIDAVTLELEVTGRDLGFLIGPKAQTLLAIQELTRTVVHIRLGDRPVRLMLDVSGYRARRRAALEQFTRQIVDEVLRTGEARRLEPMTASDRKIVHDLANTIAGVTTVSEGEDPDRQVVILPA